MPESRPFLHWDDAQLAVIRERSSVRQIVVAGPGTGKSAVACQRVARLVDDGVPAARILLLSFTRTAVAELRERIVSMAVAGDRARSVRISTIDSHAWSLRVGFDDEEAARAFGGSFELNIQRVLEMLRSGHDDLLDFLSRLEHVIVDEAQDVIGDRAELILRVLDNLPETCGVTILADPAQAIYGFTSDADNGADRGGASLLERLTQPGANGFARRELDKIYRSSDSQLLRMFQQTRKEVRQTSDHVHYALRIRDSIRDTCHSDIGTFGPSDLPQLIRAIDRGSTLVLFRRRVEVLAASSYLSGAGVPHRLRMSGLACVVRPWVGWLFYGAQQAIVGKSEFSQLWSDRGSVASNPFEDLREDEAWQLLHHLAAADRPGHIDLVYLRRLIARDQPPIELCYPELGASGPILGTIHGSKGREANSVVLVLPAIDPDHEDRGVEGELEEGRVLYVGATRARESLYVAEGRRTSGRYLSSGRVFRLLGGNRTQFEVGRHSDVDPFAHLSWSSVDAIQQVLASSVGRSLPAKARAVPELDFIPRLYVEADGDEVLCGQMSRRFHQDLNELWNRLKGAQHLRPAMEIQHLYLFAVSTVAVPDDHASSATLARTGGFALAPVAKGFPMIPFFRRSGSR